MVMGRMKEKKIFYKTRHLVTRSPATVCPSDGCANDLLVSGRH